MPSRAEVVQQLRDAGYDGPVSYTKARLEEILLSTASPTVADNPPATGPVDTETGSQEPSRGRRGRRQPYGVPDPFERWPSWGDHLHRGVEFRVVDEGGWFRFLNLVRNPRTGEYWVDAVGGNGKHHQSRSFRPERIKMGKNGKPVTRKARHNKTEDES